jgi:Sulfotransferase domain
MKRPDFFIVGAPKCGTTALDDYLGQHPQIFMAQKEMHFFGSDLRSKMYIRDPDKYLGKFADVAPEQIAGESSVWYLSSENAAREIKAFNDSAKIIIMLRNPSDMIYSLYSQVYFNGYEDQPTFEGALDAEWDRLHGRRIPKKQYGPHHVFYRRAANFAPQVQRYLDVFGQDNTHIIVYDDFANRTAEAYRRTLDFLGVDPGFVPRLQVVNANKVVRSTALRALTRYPPRPILSVVKALFPMDLLKTAHTAVRNFNTLYVERPDMDPALRADLCREFAPGVEQLSELLKRDLTYWCKA